MYTMAMMTVLLLLGLFKVRHASAATVCQPSVVGRPGQRPTRLM